jgi:hypothetical protein
MPTTSQNRASPAEGSARTAHGGAWRQAPRQGGRSGAPQPPSPFAPDAEWRAWRRARRAAGPPWFYDADWLTSHALEERALPVVAERLGLGDFVCELPRPRWWFGPALHAEAAALHLAPLPDLLPVLAVRLAPDAYDLLFLDQSLGGWEVPNLSRRGGNLVELAAWRWGMTLTKAAWRLARILGLGEPRP